MPSGLITEWCFYHENSNATKLPINHGSHYSYAMLNFKIFLPPVATSISGGGDLTKSPPDTSGLHYENIRVDHHYIGLGCALEFTQPQCCLFHRENLLAPALNLKLYHHAMVFLWNADWFCLLLKSDVWYYMADCITVNLLHKLLVSDALSKAG